MQNQQCKNNDVAMLLRGPMLVFLHSSLLGCLSQSLFLNTDRDADIFSILLANFLLVFSDLKEAFFPNIAMLKLSMGSYQVFSIN